MDEERYPALPWQGWKIVKRLGRGGYGSVYLAQRNSAGVMEDAAVKVISFPKNEEDIEADFTDGYDLVSVRNKYKNMLHRYVDEYQIMLAFKGQTNIVSCDDFEAKPHKDGIGWDLPYSAMAPLMTNDEEDLAKLNIFRMSMSPVSNMIVTALSLPLINFLGGDQRAWIIVTAVYGIIAFGMLMWTFLGTKERFHTEAAAEAENLPFRVRLKAAAQNKYFIIMFLMVMALALYQNVNGTVSTYYAQYVLGNAEIMGVMQTCEKIPWILGIICMAPLIKKFGKRNLVLGGAIICIAAQIILMINPENMKLVLAASIIRGLGEAPINGLTFTMLADVINYGHWKTGIRVHALIFSTFTVGQKFGGGVAGWAIGQLMQLSGFTGSVTETVEAVAMIKNLYIYGVILAWGLIAICMLAYHLDKEYDQVLAELK